MPSRIRKQRRSQTVQVSPDDGLDLSRPAGMIKNSALSVAETVWYDPSYGLCTRYGLALTDFPALAGGIQSLYAYARPGGEAILVAAAAGAFYQADFTAVRWVRIGGESYPSQCVPQFCTFNGTLVAACGSSSGLWIFDGTASSFVTGSPRYATVLAVMGGRLVSNGALGSGGNEAWLDYVHFSGPYDLTAWNTSSTGNGALSIAAGFGDGGTVNGLAVLYGSLVVSKVIQDSSGQVTGKRLFAIATSGTPENWAGVQLSGVNAALPGEALLGLSGFVLFVDDDGIQSWRPAPGGAYGDIALDPDLGSKINKALGTYAKNAEFARVWFCRQLGQVWILVRAGGYRMVTFDLAGGRFTTLSSDVIRPMTFCEFDGHIYWAGDRGDLYVMDNKGTDTCEDGTEANINSVVKTKRFEDMNDLVLKAVRVDTLVLRTGRLRVDCVTGDDTNMVFLGEVTYRERSASQKLYYADDLLVDATYKLYGDETFSSEQNDFRPNGPRSQALSIQMRTLGGRVRFNSIFVAFAKVG